MSVSLVYKTLRFYVCEQNTKSKHKQCGNISVEYGRLENIYFRDL